MIIQAAANGLVATGTYLLIAIGFSLIYSTARFFHFTHGIVFTFGAYFAYSFSTELKLALPQSFLFSIILTAFLGCLLELLIYRPLRRQKASSLILLLASLGLYIILQNTISLIFGDDSKSILSGTVSEGIDIWGARMTLIQIITICASVALTVIVVVISRGTKLGKAMRAVANDSDLAFILGVNRDVVILTAFAIGSAAAGLAGILVSLDVNMSPTMGMRALLMGVVAVIIGGAGRISGAVFGALFLGVALQLGVLVTSSQWQDTIAFVILVGFLIFRPQGILGVKSSTI
jgi:branched-chain amino acid transport system permease protein